MLYKLINVAILPISQKAYYMYISHSLSPCSTLREGSNKDNPSGRGGVVDVAMQRLRIVRTP
jgi:hypothetical protein